MTAPCPTCGGTGRALDPTVAASTLNVAARAQEAA
jgi:hypothetical protein